VKPENWHCVENPTREESKPHHEAGDTEHPLVLAYFAGRRRVREVMADGFVESHPNVEPFLAEMARLVVLNEAGQEESDEAEELRSHLDVLWDALDEEEQSFVRHFKRAAPEWRPEEE
jgi:hypothetical protein